MGDCRRRWPGAASLAVIERRRTPTAALTVGGAAVVLWGLLQIAFANTFLFHDSWKHQFPVLFSVVRQMTCGPLPQWIPNVDSGSPLIIYAISFSVTQLSRLPMLFLAGCLQPGIVAALHLHKAQIALGYLGLSAGMFVLGCVLFERRLAAGYLAVATLYAGLFLDASHSDQVIAMLFWMPWVVACGVQFHRHRDVPAAAWYLNGIILFLGVQMVDQYPQFAMLTGAVGAALYALLWPREAWAARRWLPRLWPAAIVVVVTAVDLWLVKGVIAPYRPSLRADLIVDPALFGETGFVQPTALIGSFLPLGFLAGFEGLGDSMAGWLATHQSSPLSLVTVQRSFIFRLDVLLFYLGFVPTVLAVAFAIRPGRGRLRLWWLGFAVALFAVSLQQSGLYFLLYRVPFFEVFRSYFLYVVLVAWAGLIMSGYGMDVVLTCPPDVRRRLLGRSLAIVFAMTAVSGLAVAGLLLRGVPPGVLRRTLVGLGCDALLVAVGTIAVVLAGRSRAPQRAAVGLIAVLTVSQAAYFVGVHRLEGMPLPELLRQYGVEARDLGAQPGYLDADPDVFRRRECRVFAQCYLAADDTASLRTDLQGTFLRHREEAIFQRGLAQGPVMALSGITHPMFWLSHRAIPYGDKHELVERLNAEQGRISAYLQEVVHVESADILAAGSGVPRASVGDALTRVWRVRDVVRVGYHLTGPGLLNASITYDQNWRATVGGRPVKVMRGNFNGLLIPLPPGTDAVELSYDSGATKLFFGLRYVCLAVALTAALLLVRGTRCLGTPRPESRPAL